MNKDLTVGKPYKTLWLFCLPLFGSIIFQQLYNLADSFVAGKFISNNALAAVGNSYEITLVFLAFAFGCNIGCSVIVSRYFGAKNYTDLKTTVYTTLVSSAVLCAVLMIVGLLCGELLLKLINTPDELLQHSLTYLNIYVWGLPFVFFYNVATGIFAALGDSKTPFIFLACSSIANIGMDILFVTVFKMGIAGVAWATFICQGVSCIISLVVVFIRVSKIKSTAKPSIFSFRIFKQVVAIAVPSILQQSFVSVGNIIVQGVINSFGAAVMAGYSASIKLHNMIVSGFVTLANGVSNYTSQNIGAGKMDRVRPGFRSGLLLLWILSVPVILIYMLLGKYLVALFLEDPTGEALAVGTLFLMIVAPFYLVISVKVISDGVLRGAGMMWQFMVTTFFDLVIRVVLAFVLSKTSLATTGLWLAWPIGWSLATPLSFMFYKIKKFDKKAAKAQIEEPETIT